jgi:hypothetical protein
MKYRVPFVVLLLAGLISATGLLATRGPAQECSTAIFTAESTPDGRLVSESQRIKDLLRPLKTRERRECADISRLDNASGTGWLPSLLAAEADSMTKTAALLGKNPAEAELAAVQKAEAERALPLLKAIK